MELRPAVQVRSSSLGLDGQESVISSLAAVLARPVAHFRVGSRPEGAELFLRDFILRAMAVGRGAISRHHQLVFRYLNQEEQLEPTARALAEKVFTGGPVEDFEATGRAQIVTLLRSGLYPHSKVLDVGCGCVRGGYWLVRFLDRDGYCGIEPNREMLEAGIEALLPPELVEAKQPRFDHNDTFDFSVFGEEFDFVVALSVWTHASKSQIDRMLASFAETASPNGVFLPSYLRAGLVFRDYKGDEWVGRSHESDVAGMVYHSYRWIEACSARHGLRVRETGFERIAGQRWLYITRR